MEVLKNPAKYASTKYHVCGSNSKVINSDFKVINNGIPMQNLRIADISIVKNIPNYNTMSWAYFIGYVVAQELTKS